MKIEKILVVDDDPLVRDLLAETLRRLQIETFVAEDGKKALSLLRKEEVDLIFTDVQMPKMGGMELLEEVRGKALVVVITAHGTIEGAVEAMKKGAFHYLVKPFSIDAIEMLIKKGEEHLSLLCENQFLREELGKTDAHPIIGESPAIREIIQTIDKVAKSNASVFIHGESGVGKEVIAHAIHYSSHRAQKPFIKVNCAAIPETLIESEFFGHEKGAFTGALAKKPGRFELADQGSILLDEISEIPLGLQAKLLRVTQEKEFERVGGTKSIGVDIRIISTTNRSIEEMLREKIMREDLFYRLNVVPIFVPPLRERKEDIPSLAAHLAERLCLENNRPPKTLTQEAVAKLQEHDWPGNVRELSNIIERAIVTMDPKEEEIGVENIYLDQRSVKY